MSLYVDRLFRTRRSPRWPFDEASHLTGDTLEELHDFAGRLGLRRRWFQDVRLPHYDLDRILHLAALDAGAILVPSRRIVVVARSLRVAELARRGVASE